MKKLANASLLAVLIVFGITGCGDGNNEPKPITEIQNFAYVSTEIYTQNRTSMDDITALNQWLLANPNKKVVSFSGVLAYREGVSGYVIYFVPGNNSQQKFERINRSDRYLHKPGQPVHGIRSLQEWKNDHPNARVLAISTVPSYSGGVREFTICYE